VLVRTRLYHLALASVLLGLESCASVPLSNTSNFTPSQMILAAPQTAAPNDAYVLQLGDVLDIKFFYNPELNEQVSIRPDGKISLQLIDEVKAEGLTPAALDAFLTEQYARILRQPEITVVVREFAGQRVYVGGEVASPGVIRTPGNLTALQAISQAGGFKSTAELSSVVILRNQGTQTPLFLTLDLKEDLTTHINHNDIVLQPYDVVFVPQSRIAKMNQFVEQYIDKLIPVTRTLGVFWSFELNPAKIQGK